MAFLIKNALVVDGAGKPGKVEDVMVEGERIKASGPGLSAGHGIEVINAEGLALCPGFIDAHSHSDLSILAAPEATGKITQGVTTEIIGNCGLSAFPVNACNRTHLEELYSNYGIKIFWSSLREYAGEINRRKPAVNILALCGHNTLRAAAAGYEQRELSGSQQTAMLAMLNDSLAQGAAGLSSGLLYVPGKFSDAEELRRLLAALAVFERPYATHLRSEGKQLLEAIEEAVQSCEAAKQRKLHISHLKAAGEKNWSKLDAALNAIDQAAARGVTVTADCYPYIESMTQLSIILPEPYDDMDDIALQKFMAVEQNFAAVCARMAEYPPRRWQTARLVNTSAPGMNGFAGLTFEQIASALQAQPEQICAEILRADAAGAMAAFQGMSAKNVKRIAALPFSACGTDESSRPPDYSIGRSHPRGFGSFPAFFELLQDALPLEQIIRKCTVLPAAIFNIKDRGRIVPGAYADLVLFDPQQFRAHADFSNPHLPASGVCSVWVNGCRACINGKPEANRSGKFIAL
ncbi:MAG: N-acyl-D-amino-acid deacylase family protein [Victivallaceae bacterium]